MIVYVETNFILELAYLRPTSDNCQRLIEFAREARISLVVPAFALIEARLAWQRNVKRRNRLHSEVRNELGEFARSRPLVDIAAQSQTFVAALIDTAEQDRARLETSLAALQAIATIVPIETTIIASALSAERRLDLSPQDAVVYATVIAHAADSGSTPKLFVTQNSTDFRVPMIEDELAARDCKLLVAFDDAEAYIRAALGLT